MFIVSINDLEMVGICFFLFFSFSHSLKGALGSGQTLA